MRYRTAGLIGTAVGLLLVVTTGCGPRNRPPAETADAIVFSTDNGREGFRSYLASPFFKAFAAARGPDGRFNSWGKA